MTRFRAEQSSTLRRRLASCVAALALLAGCTTVADGAPSATDGSSGDGAQPGAASSASSPTTASSDPQSEALQTPAPTSTDLIAAALKSGEIDEPTSLLYRTYLYFGDPQLPDEFVGAPEAHDLGLITELRDRIDDLPEDIRAQIEPYLLRPADPDSAFNATGPPGLRGSAPSAVRASGGKETPTKCSEGWATHPIDGGLFRIWACKNIGGSDPGAVASAMSTVAGMIKKYVPRMSADMGKLMLDDPDLQSDPRADDLIDVYVLPSGWFGPMRANYTSAPDYAKNIASPPRVGVGRTSYIMVASDHLGDTALMERMVVHELFHAFQNARNTDTTTSTPADWWVEGSAEWAAAYYVRYDSARLHEERLPRLQDYRRFSLTSSVGLRPYGAYLWPLFMEQEVGADSIFAVWQDLATTNNGADYRTVMTALNEQLDVSSNFPEFVMRLFNANSLQGDPISPRFVDLDPHFPDGRMPENIPQYTLGDKPLVIDSSLVPSLGYRYRHIKVPPAKGASATSGILVNISGTVTKDSGGPVSLEALVHGVDGDYRRIPVSYSGDGANVCVTKDMYLVMANPQAMTFGYTSGDLTLRRLKNKPCSRVEVTGPATLVRLAKAGDVVAVDGTENDDKPGTAPILITVFDVLPKLVKDYRVEITLSGGTLASPRHLTWPLAGFDVVVPGQRYRKEAVISLDKDLTDANRDFTIEARLVKKTDEISVHAPTVELHGLKPCDPDETDVTCELVGDLTFTFDGEYTTASHAGTAHIAGTLSLRLGQLGSDPNSFERTYPDVGSTWTMSGSAEFKRCLDGQCSPSSVQQSFTSASNGDLDVYLSPSVRGLELVAAVPVRQSITATGTELDVIISPHAIWSLGCPKVPTADFSPNASFWDNKGRSSVLDLPERFEDSFATWNDARTELSFQCSKTWETHLGSRRGETGSIAYSLNGTLRWVRVDE